MSILPEYANLIISMLCVSVRLTIHSLKRVKNVTRARKREFDYNYALCICTADESLTKACGFSREADIHLAMLKCRSRQETRI